MHILIYTSLVIASAFAHTLDPHQPRCESLLGRTVERITAVPEEIVWKQEPGIGNFAMVSSSWPPVNAATEANAHRQGIISWFHSIGVAPSVEVARERDAHKIAYKQIMYLITDGSAEDLQATESLKKDSVSEQDLLERRARGRDRFRDLFREGYTKVVYFQEPTFDPELHYRGDPFMGIHQLYYKGTETPVPRDLVEIPVEDARRVFHADEMGVTRDERGVLFRQYGWFRLHRRGIMTFAHTFRRAEGINPSASTPKKSWALLRNLADAGWTFTPNSNLDEVLEMAKSMIHNVAGQREMGEGEEANSRYLEQHVEDMTREAFARGEAFTRELRDPQGVLRGAAIGFFGPGQMIMMDTVVGVSAPKIAMKKDQTNGTYKAIEIRKAMILEGLVWAYQLGYDMIDTQVVTNTTGPMKAFYITPDEFMIRVHAKPAPARPDLSVPWTLPTLEELHGYGKMGPPRPLAPPSPKLARPRP